MYNVKLKNFEGPLDLLLELIGKNKLDINDISLARITNQYLEYLEKRENIDLNNLADFLTVASKLILIKSKSLLPLLQFDEDEEEEIADLTQQITEYKKFKEIAVVLDSIYEKNKISYSREIFFDEKVIFSPPEDMVVDSLEKIYNDVLDEVPVMQKIEEKKIRNITSLKEKIISLEELIQKKMKLSFYKLLKKKSNRAETVVSFLAILEMIKQDIIVVEQQKIFDDIILKKKV